MLASQSDFDLNHPRSLEFKRNKLKNKTCKLCRKTLNCLFPLK